MRKLLIAILILLCLLLLTLPTVVGRQAEAQYHGFLNQLQLSGLKVVRNDYQRGWFEAQAETELELPLPQAEMADGEAPAGLRLVLAHRIHHGPFAPEGGELGDRLAIDTEILSGGVPLFPTDHPATIQTRVALSGEGRTLIDLPALELPAEKGHPHIRFQGAKGDVAFHLDDGQLAIELGMPNLQIDNQRSAVLEISGLSVAGAYQQDGSGLLLGQGGLKIERLAARSQGDVGRMEVQGLQISADSALEQGLVKGGIRYQVATLQMEEDSYGQLELELRLANIAAPLLAQLQQAMEEMSDQSLTPDQQGMALMSVLMGNGPVLLQGDPRFSIARLYAETPDGVIEGQLDLQTVGLAWEELSRLDQAVNKLRASASLRMPEASFRALFAQQTRQALLLQLEQRRMQGAELPDPSPEQLEERAAMLAEQQLQALLQQQVLVRSERGIETVASLDDGLLTINGKSLPLSMVLAPPPQ